MKTTSLWIIRVALTVANSSAFWRFALVAASDSPRAMWMADWLRRRWSNVRAAFCGFVTAGFLL
jgi:hypothetical protein